MDDFERIYAEYYDQVYGYCLRLTHDPHMAEEVTQESFFKALKAIGSFHGECRLQVWLCQIAKNTYFSLLKKQKRSAPLEGDWPAPADLEGAPGGQGGRPENPPGAPPAGGALPGGLLAAGLWGAELRPDWRAV